jgi:putative transposase
MTTGYFKPPQPLTVERYRAWVQSLSLPAAGAALIERIRSSPPSRLVRATPHSRVARYASRKMGHTIQAEAGSTELEWIVWKDFDPGVLEIYDQPMSFRITHHAGAPPRRISYLHTPDFFVLEETAAGFCELKPEEKLAQLSLRWPERYVQTESGWRCPPGEVYANPLGLFYRVVSSADIPHRLVATLRFLEDFIDDAEVDDAMRTFVIEAVTSHPGVRLSDLLATPVVRQWPDDLYRMVVRGDIYVDLDRERIEDSASVHVYASREMARAVAETRPNDLAIPADQPSLGDVSVTPALANASPEQLRQALRRRAVVMALLRGEPTPSVSPRTRRAWVSRHSNAERACGNGLVGLLDQPRPGNRTERYPPAILAMTEKAIELDYLTAEAPSVGRAYAALTAPCEAAGLSTPSLQWFRQRVRLAERATSAVRKRRGHRVAYQVSDFFWTLHTDTPVHGMYPANVGHIDHTELDIQLRCPRTGIVLGRPWLTLLMDAFTRRILAFWITFDPPSYRSDMMVLRLCILRFGRLPRRLVSDGGSDFRSVYYETLLASADCHAERRPTGAARAGSVIERLFGTTNTEFIHDCVGNTKAARRVRELTKDVDPRRLSTWDLETLHEALSEFFYEIYDETVHSVLGVSPRDAWDMGQHQTGYRQRRRIAVDREFAIVTMPTTRKGTAKVQVPAGVKINSLWYWNEALRRYPGENVKVKFDPFDVTHAYALLGDRWVELDCSPELQRFRCLSLRSLGILTAEIRKRGQLSRTASASSRLIARMLTNELPAKVKIQILGDASTLAVTARLAAQYPSLAVAGPVTHLNILLPTFVEPAGEQSAPPPTPMAASEAPLPRFGSY